MSGFGERAIAYEIKNLADEDSRDSAIRTLKAFGKAAIPQLVDVLGDPSRNAYAAVILSDLGEPAISSLLSALGDDSKKSFASAALKEMAKKKSNTQPTIILDLIGALYDKRPQTRAIAAVTLQSFGSNTMEPYIPKLIDALANPDAAPFAGNILIGIGKPVVEPLRKVTDENRREIINTIIGKIAETDNTIPHQTPSNKNTTPIPTAPESPAPIPKFCSTCGAQLTSTSIYCSQCGKKVG